MGGNTGDTEGIGHAANTDLPLGAVNAAGTGAERAGTKRIFAHVFHGILTFFVCSLPPYYTTNAERLQDFCCFFWFTN
jgi:hypothetical protein